MRPDTEPRTLTLLVVLALIVAVAYGSYVWVRVGGVYGAAVVTAAGEMTP